MKLGNIFPSDGFVISQSPHGAYQNNKSLDCFGNGGILNVIAPSDGIVYIENQEDTSGHWFDFYGDGFFIRFVHCDAHRKGKFKKGEYLGQTTWHHIHVAINIKDTWDVLLNYMDRNIKLSTTLKPSNGWDNWDKYPDLHINNSTMRAYDAIGMETPEYGDMRLPEGARDLYWNRLLKEDFPELLKKDNIEGQYYFQAQYILERMYKYKDDLTKSKKEVTQLKKVNAQLREQLKNCEGKDCNETIDEIINFCKSKKS